MQSSGQGLTFTDEDVKMARVLVGLLSRVATYKDINSQNIVEGAASFKWLEELVGKIKDNVLDFSTAKMTEPASTGAEAPVAVGTQPNA